MTHLNLHVGTVQTFCPKILFFLFLNILNGNLSVGDLNFTACFKILFRKSFVKFLAKTLKLTKYVWSWMSMNCVIGKTIWELRTVRHPFYLNRHPNRISMIGTRVGSSILLNKNPFSKSWQWSNQMIRQQTLPNFWTRRRSTQTADYYMNTLFKVYTL